MGSSVLRVVKVPAHHYIISMQTGSAEDLAIIADVSNPICPPLPHEILEMIMLECGRADPPVVDATTGRAKNLGWVLILRVPVLRGILVAFSKVFAENLTSLPVAFPQFLQWSKGSRLYFEISKRVPRTCDSTLLKPEPRLRLWEQLISRPNAVERVTYLRMPVRGSRFRIPGASVSFTDQTVREVSLPA